MGVVPELGSYEELGTVDAGFLDGCSYHGFRAVDWGRVLLILLGSVDGGLTSRGIDVQISGLESFGNRVLLIIFVLPGTKANGWDTGACVKLLHGYGCHVAFW